MLIQPNSHRPPPTPTPPHRQFLTGDFCKKRGSLIPRKGRWFGLLLQVAINPALKPLSLAVQWVHRSVARIGYGRFTRICIWSAPVLGAMLKDAHAYLKQLHEKHPRWFNYRSITNFSA